MEEFGGIIDAPTMGGPSQVLVFNVDGRTVFTRRVYHPPQPYMRPGFAVGTPAAIAAVGRTWWTAIQAAA